MTDVSRIGENYVEDTLKKLIAINSVLPNEKEITEFIADELRSFGVEPEMQKVAPGRFNICASIRLGFSEKFLVFSGHSDTVEAAADWETDPFEAVISDGRLYGLGAINMKSGLACMLGAFRALVQCESKGEKKGKLGLAICVDQEGQSLGAKELLNTQYGECDAMLHAEHFFGDSESDYLPNAVTGKVLYNITVCGEAGHAFRPHEGGVNAIMDAAQIVNALENIQMKEHPEFGKGTVCVLKIEGGYEEYSIVIPEKCRVIITRLTVPGETSEMARQDMQNLINSLSLKSSVEIEMAQPSYEPYYLDESLPFVRIFRNVYCQVIGTEPCFAHHKGVVDSNVFSGEGGILNIVFGPKGGLHHRAGEFVELKTLPLVAETYVKTAIGFLSE